MDQVGHYISGKPQWEEGLHTLRALLLEFPFEECIKWNAPVYMAHGRNLVGLSAFKGHFGLWFFEGAALDDPAGVLTNAQQGKTQHMRQWKFSETAIPDPHLIRQYLRETLEKAATTPAPFRDKKSTKAANEGALPGPMAAAFAEDPDLRRAFEQFPAYKQREFTEHLEEARRDETRLRRLQKILPMIRRGEGLNDKYR